MSAKRNAGFRDIADLGDSQRQTSGVGLWGLLLLKAVKVHCL